MTGPDRYAWERPGHFEVAPGVHRIPLPLPNDSLHAVNVYAIVEGRQLVLIDSGWALELSEALLEEALAELDFSLGSIERFLITHVHRDHYTQALAIRKRFGTRVSLGAGEMPTVDEHLSNFETMPKAIVDRLVLADAGTLVAALAAEPASADDEWSGHGRPDDWLRGGMTIEIGNRRLDVIETPGHTAGHVVFHDAAAGLLFAGDHVLPHITPSIGFETLPPPSPLTDYLASLRTVEAMADSVLLPAHGPPRPSTRARVVELIAHHERRLDAAEGAVRAGCVTGIEVARALRWTSRERDFAELDLLNQVLAVSETLAHLDVLVTQGRLGATTVDGSRHFSL